MIIAALSFFSICTGTAVIYCGDSVMTLTIGGLALAAGAVGMGITVGNSL